MYFATVGTPDWDLHLLNILHTYIYESNCLRRKKKRVSRLPEVREREREKEGTKILKIEVSEVNGGRDNVRQLR